MSRFAVVAAFAIAAEASRLRVRAPSTLRDAAAAAGLYAGSALNIGCINNASEPYAKIAAAQFNLMTVENDCKFGETEPQRGVFQLQNCAATANFGIKNGMAHRLHNLVWGANNPGWLLGINNPTTLVDVMTNHINALIAGMGNASYAVDVVNEAVADSGSETFKPSPPWYPAVPDYVEQAFRLADAARKASGVPNLLLFYNDYGAEDMGTKSGKVYNMLKDFKSRGVPVDGVGLQMHIDVDGYPSVADMSANIARLVALGLQVHITEMDVRCKPPCGADRLATQATIYAGVVKACKDNSVAPGTAGCKSVETWGFTDRHTWITDFDNPTHADEKPLQWDVNYNTKPAFTAQLAAFSA